MGWGLAKNAQTQLTEGPAQRQRTNAKGDARVNRREFAFEIVLADIQTLNERAERGEYDITAISAAQYPFVQDRYAVTSCGASFGENYGPKLVVQATRAGGTPALPDLRRSDYPIAVPGLRTTAALLTALILECSFERFVAVPFDSIIERVASREFEAGVVIHEGQLSFESAGLRLVQDVGAWWWERHHLPLPLGLNVIRRDLSLREQQSSRAAEQQRTLQQITSILRNSIQFGLDHRAEAVAAVMPYARGITIEQADQFISMYVNRYTLDMGARGKRAIEVLLHEGHAMGYLPKCDEIEVIHPLSVGP